MTKHSLVLVRIPLEKVLALHRLGVLPCAPRECAGCNEWFAPTHSSQLFCRYNCGANVRVKAFRKRRQEAKQSENHADTGIVG